MLRQKALRPVDLPDGLEYLQLRPCKGLVRDGELLELDLSGLSGLLRVRVSGDFLNYRSDDSHFVTVRKGLYRRK